MESDDVSSAVKVPYSNLHVGVHNDISTMTHAIHARLEDGLANELTNRVIGALGLALRMDTDTLRQFLRFLSEDADLQARFTAWRVAKRITE